MRTASEWAESKRQLPAGSAEPGPFRADRAPWIRVITERAQDPRHRIICAVMGSQMSKTDGVLLNLIGHRLDDDPAPILYIGPTQKNVESIAGNAQKGKGRVGAMIRGVPSLYEGLMKGKDEKLTEKFINGARLGFGWAGSDTELASHAAALGLLDEYDRMKPSKDEGDPLGLLKARTATYSDGTVVVTSTPLAGEVKEETLSTGLTHWGVAEPDDIQSPTWLVWQEGTRHEWTWPCPYCDEYFIARGSLLWWDDSADLATIEREAKLTCPHCGAMIDNRDKADMNRRGVPVAPGQSVTTAGQVIGLEPDNTTFSLWVSGLCSNWVTFGERAAEIAKAKKTGLESKEQVAVNTGLGELFSPTGEKFDWRQVYAHRGEHLQGQIPDDVVKLVGGGDVGKDSFYYSIRGWAPGGKTYLIDYGVFYGATSQPEIWALVDKLVMSDYNGMRISRFAIDSGYNPGDEIEGIKQDIVYQFCRTHKGVCIPTKGHDVLANGKLFYASPVDVNWKGRVLKNGVKLWHFDTDVFKSLVHSEINKDAGTSAFILPANITEEYCKHQVAEYRKTDQRGRPSWVRRDKANHWFDCEVLARMVGASMQLDRIARPSVALPPVSAEHDRQKRRNSQTSAGNWVSGRGAGGSGGSGWL